MAPVLASTSNKPGSAPSPAVTKSKPTAGVPLVCSSVGREELPLLLHSNLKRTAFVGPFQSTTIASRKSVGGPLMSARSSLL